MNQPVILIWKMPSKKNKIQSEAVKDAAYFIFMPYALPTIDTCIRASA